MIRWEDNGYGFIGRNIPVFYISCGVNLYCMLPHKKNDENKYIGGYTIDEAKQKAEETLKDWLDKANLQIKS